MSFNDKMEIRWRYQALDEGYNKEGNICIGPRVPNYVWSSQNRVNNVIGIFRKKVNLRFRSQSHQHWVLLNTHFTTESHSLLKKVLSQLRRNYLRYQAITVYCRIVYETLLQIFIWWKVLATNRPFRTTTKLPSGSNCCKDWTLIPNTSFVKTTFLGRL